MNTSMKCIAIALIGVLGSAATAVAQQSSPGVTTQPAASTSPRWPAWQALSSAGSAAQTVTWPVCLSTSTRARSFPVAASYKVTFVG